MLEFREPDFLSQLYGAIGDFIGRGVVSPMILCSVGRSGVRVCRLVHPNKSVERGLLFLRLEGADTEREVFTVYRAETDGMFDLGRDSVLGRLELADPAFFERLREILVAQKVFRA